MSIGMEGDGPNPRVYSKAEYDALAAECERLRQRPVTQTASEQTAMTNKPEIPPSVAEFALQKLADQKLISRYEVTAENLEVLRARLARYEDEDGNPKAQPNTPVSAKDAPYMSDDTDPREAWADGYNAAVEEQMGGAE